MKSKAVHIVKTEARYEMTRDEIDEAVIQWLDRNGVPNAADGKIEYDILIRITDNGDVEDLVGATVTIESDHKTKKPPKASA